MNPALPVIFVTILSAGFYGLLLLAGFAILKQIKSWPLVFVLAFGMATVSIAMSSMAYLLQGWERAAAMFIPGGEYFAVVGLPMMINAVITMTIIMASAYGLFVASGKQRQ
jgi:hypothetical protein